MFASSSTSLARAMISAPAQAARSFSSSSSVLASRRRELVELLADHERLGLKGDRVLVAPGYARHRLVPRRIARFVPHWKWYGIKPFRQSPLMSESPQIEAPSTLPTSTATPRKPTSPELLDRLNAVPNVLTFELRTVETDQTTLHGSLTLNDVLVEVKKSGLSDGEVFVKWADEGVSGDRMKTTGTREAMVCIKGRPEEHVVIEIKVVGLEEVQVN